MPMHTVKKIQPSDVHQHDNYCTCSHCLDYWEEHDKIYEDDIIPFDEAFEGIDNILGGEASNEES